MEQTDKNLPPIACSLNALTDAERHREGELLDLHLESIRERRERADGYSYRYPEDPGLFARMAELVGLEHRCCPFLDSRLEWAGAEATPWLHVTGGARVKPFVADTFGAPHD
ncbi:hypothetical protein AKJ09_02893 [Labilithrix luteola]|uniref:Uncharacterized protein n=1 Tax=Labilithrix luteola TaxID=1391654 RepID=A0A0K1PSZ2_9BACT|nr:hypothetical protein [Labilithrix luteola]AKU96229.1 hypothetical protein AKJ09_02893 [Labilithrix luteola]